jgi:hypothetical protein
MESTSILNIAWRIHLSDYIRCSSMSFGIGEYVLAAVDFRRFAIIKMGIFSHLPDYFKIAFSLDFLRLDASLVGGININQTVMAVVAVFATAALLWRHRRASRLAPA